MRVSRVPSIRPCLRGNAARQDGPDQFVVSEDGRRIALACGLNQLEIIDTAAPTQVQVLLEMFRIELGQPAVGFRKDGARLFLFGSTSPSAQASPFALDIADASLLPIAPERLKGCRSFWPSNDWSHVLLHQADGKLMLLEGFNGKELATLTTVPPEIHDARFSPDSRFIAIASDASFALHDGLTGALRSTLDTTRPETSWQRISWSDDGRWIFTRRLLPDRPAQRLGPADSLFELIAWEAATGRRQGHWVGKDVLASASGNVIYVAPDRRRIQRVERSTGKIKLLLQDTDEGYAWGYQLLAATPDDRLLFLGVSTPGGSRIQALDATNGAEQPGW